MFDAERLLDATCTCPYDWGGWCKHIVAVLLVAHERPETVETRRPVADVLNGLDRGQLQAILLALIESESDLIDSVEMQVSLLAPPSAPAAASPAAPPVSPRPTIDISALRRQLRSLPKPRARPNSTSRC